MTYSPRFPRVHVYIAWKEMEERPMIDSGYPVAGYEVEMAGMTDRGLVRSSNLNPTPPLVPDTRNGKPI